MMGCIFSVKEERNSNFCNGVIAVFTRFSNMRILANRKTLRANFCHTLSFALVDNKTTMAARQRPSNGVYTREWN